MLKTMHPLPQLSKYSGKGTYAIKPRTNWRGSCHQNLTCGRHSINVCCGGLVE